MLAMPNLNPRNLTEQSRSVSGNMDDNIVTAVHICSIIPCSLMQGSLLDHVLVDIVSPVYLHAVCSQVTHSSCTLTGHYVICRHCSSNSILKSAQYFGH